MVEFALQVAIAPALVGAATLAARRWGEHTGGLVSAFPAIVGPVLLIIADERGAAAAASAATGTLLGLVALSAFALAYAHAAARAGRRASLAAGWGAAAVAAAGVSATDAGPAAAFTAAALSLAVAHWALPRRAGRVGRLATVVSGRWDLPARMALTALLVVTLAAAARAFGPMAGGILAALPVLASVLAVFTHRDGGAVAVAELLRGMLGGMAGFVAFCALVAVLAVPAGVPIAFAAATVAAVALGPAVISGRTARRRRARAARAAATG